MSSETPVFQDMGRRIISAATSPKELGPRLRGDERDHKICLARFGGAFSDAIAGRRRRLDKEEGRGPGHPEAGVHAGTEGFDLAGQRVPLLAERRDEAFSVFAEYGLTDRLTLQFKGDLQRGRDAFVDFEAAAGRDRRHLAGLARRPDGGQPPMPATQTGRRPQCRLRAAGTGRQRLGGPHLHRAVVRRRRLGTGAVLYRGAGGAADAPGPAPTRPASI